MPGLAEGYRRFSKLPGNPFAADLVNLKEFLLRGAEAVLHGSAYTANHRWTAACAPLAAVHSLWPDSRYLAKIEDYLADGIDCDEDGAGTRNEAQSTYGRQLGAYDHGRLLGPHRTA